MCEAGSESEGMTIANVTALAQASRAHSATLQPQPF